MTASAYFDKYQSEPDPELLSAVVRHMTELTPAHRHLAGAEQIFQAVKSDPANGTPPRSPFPERHARRGTPGIWLRQLLGSGHGMATTVLRHARIAWPRVFSACCMTTTSEIGVPGMQVEATAAPIVPALALLPALVPPSDWV